MVTVISSKLRGPESYLGKSHPLCLLISKDYVVYDLVHIPAGLGTIIEAYIKLGIYKLS